MKTYEFTLTISEIDDETAEAIYGKCSDSSVGRCHGTTYVAFDRESESLEMAIDSAISDLRGIGVEPLRIEMDVQATVA